MPRKVRTLESLRRQIEDSKSEEIIQKEAVSLLASKGYIVKETTHRYKKPFCKRCGRRDVKCGDCGGDIITDGAYGSSMGIADLLVSCKDWNLKNVWVMVEMKKNEKANVRPDQIELRDMGLSFVCWSADMALEAVRGFERLNNLRGESNS